MSDAVDVLLTLEPDSDLDDEARDRLTRQLRSEVAELEVESVRLATGDAAPVGSKAADPVTIGAIIVALSASGGVLTSLIGVVRDLLVRQPASHRISVTIDGDPLIVDNATADQQRDLIAAYISKHTAP
jgi:hypothetical protein